MNVKNLLNYPVKLGDGQMIGATGTNSDTRKYGKKELTERDQKRVTSGKLEVVNVAADTENQTSSEDGKTKNKGVNK